MLNKVLLIDDSVTIHRVIDLSIDLERLSLVKVFNRKDAEEKLQSDKFDYILLDNKLDDIQVNSFIKELKSKYPSTKLILLVGAFDKFSEQDLVNTGADDFLVKPFDSETLNFKLSDTTEIVEDIPTPIYFPEDTNDIDNIDDDDFITDTIGVDNLDDIIGTSDIENIDDIDVDKILDTIDDDTLDLPELDTLDLLADNDTDIISHKDIGDIDDIDFSAIDDEFATGDDIDLLDLKSDLFDNSLEGIDAITDTDIISSDDVLGEVDDLMGGINNDHVGTDDEFVNSNTSYTNISDDAFKDIDLLLGDFDENFSTDSNPDVDLLSIPTDTSSDEAVKGDDLMDRVGFISNDVDDDPVLDDINEQLEHIDNLDIDTLSAISEIEKDINDVVIDTDDSASTVESVETKDVGIDFTLDDIDVSAVPVERSTDLNVEDIEELHTESGMDSKEASIINVADVEDLSDLHAEADLHTESDIHTENEVDNLNKEVSSTLYDEVIVPTLNEYEKRFDSIQSKNAKKKSYEDSLLDTEEISFIDDKTQSDTSTDINFNISKDEIYSILANSLSKKFLQESIKDILSDHIKELVRDVIPTIAEKYIKEEIERLKSDV